MLTVIKYPRLFSPAVWEFITTLRTDPRRDMVMARNEWVREFRCSHQQI